MVNYTKTGLALLLSLTVAQSWGMEVRAMKPSHLAALRLMHENGRFSVEREGRTEVIPSRDVSKPIRSISSKKLAKFVKKAGNFSEHQYDNGEYSVREHVRGPGGGPALGTTVYWGVKSALYGILGGAALTTAVTTGGAMVGALGGAGALAGAGTVAGKVAIGAPVAIAAKTLLATAGLAGNVATVGAVVGAAAAPAVVEATTAVVATGGFGALVAAIEGISAAAGIACGMLPTP